MVVRVLTGTCVAKGCKGGWRVSPRGRILPHVISAREGLIMRHPRQLLQSEKAYTAGMIGLGLLPVAMAIAAILVP
ncbi:hypothetical protein M2189_004853 [Bradyrhizobium japonicum]|nr:hypothetical protein [Bradyrhizobium japonicum]MCS3961650.1 hypothetical protein [Bradyrhizobium japonicum]MCS3993966.1 hypothetical protein [Bradyrhizobium japonicum]